MSRSARRAGIQLAFTARAGAAHVRALRRDLRRALPHLPRNSLREVSIALVGDTRMKQLHDRFLGDPTTTDVITFELDHDPRGRCTHGEVVVCVPVARRGARRSKTPVAHELLLYALHGLLHLCGMDDRDQRSYRAIHAREDRILASLGVGPQFSRGQTRPR